MSEARGAAAPWRRLVRPAAALALAAPLLAAPLAGRALADDLARRGGAGLADAAGHLARWIGPPPAGAAPQMPAATEDVSVQEPASIDAPAQAAPGRGRRAEKGAPARGILIRAAVVARAARSGARPSGTPVPAQGARPAGLALHGVGHFGAGLRDGDVLTAVGGTAASSVEAVIGAVAGAVRSRAKVLGATVWRGEQPIQVSVELPGRL